MKLNAEQKRIEKILSKSGRNLNVKMDLGISRKDLIRKPIGRFKLKQKKSRNFI